MTKTSKTKVKVKAWAVIDGKMFLPEIGNGKQFQHPIFSTKREATEYSKENHGIQKPQVVEVEIHYKITSKV